jgi:hypothetical protein
MIFGRTAILLCGTAALLIVLTMTPASAQHSSEGPAQAPAAGEAQAGADAPHGARAGDAAPPAAKAEDDAANAPAPGCQLRNNKKLDLIV